MKQAAVYFFLHLLLLLKSTIAFSRSPETIEEALKCMFFVTNYGQDGKPASHGTGFVIEDDGVQWIYTNAHVIEEAKRIEFVNSDSRIVTGLGRFACFSTGSGDGEIGEGSEKIRFGGDGVRIELKERRELAFEIERDKKTPEIGWEVITLGDNDGNKKMDVLEGKITALSRNIIQSTCKTRPGSSGGALLLKDNLKVIGLHTWGMEASIDLKEAIWQKRQESGKAAGASMVGNAAWVEIKASDFLNGSLEAMKFRDTVRILFLIYSMVPQESGFKIDPSTLVAQNVTLEQAFSRYERDTVLRPVLDLNQRLVRARGNIGVNNMELVKVYAKALQDIRASYKRQKAELGKTLAPYYRIRIEQSGFYEVGDWCHDGLLDAQVWFESKARLGGTMPVGRWFNLRPLSELGK